MIAFCGSLLKTAVSERSLKPWDDLCKIVRHLFCRSGKGLSSYRRRGILKSIPPSKITFQHNGITTASAWIPSYAQADMRSTLAISNLVGREKNTSIIDCEPRGSSIISVTAQHLLIRRGQPLCTSTLFLSNPFSLHNNKSSPNPTPQMMFENRGCARSKKQKDGRICVVRILSLSFFVSSMKKV